MADRTKRQLDIDPMGSWDGFKWTVSNPQELKNALDEIDGMSTKRLKEGRRRAKKFSSDYLNPVTEEGVLKFLEA